MSCPDFESCNKKNCIEQGVCLSGDYWSKYWQQQKYNKSLEWAERKAAKKKKGLENRVEYLKDKPVCVKNGDTCDKQASCTILGQCIAEVPRFKNNRVLLTLFKGPRTPELIIKFLKEHDPEPMKSYSLHKKK